MMVSAIVEVGLLGTLWPLGVDGERGGGTSMEGLRCWARLEDGQGSLYFIILIKVVFLPLGLVHGFLALSCTSISHSYIVISFL